MMKLKIKMVRYHYIPKDAQNTDPEYDNTNTV